MNINVFCAFPLLKTKRLVLDNLNKARIEELVPIAMRKGEITATLEAAEIILQLNEANYARQKSICWGIYLNNSLIGVCGYYRGFTDDSGELGYILNEHYFRNGYMYEAAERIIEFGMEEMNLVEMSAYTAPSNTASIALLHKLNFVASAIQTEGDLLKFILKKKP